MRDKILFIVVAFMLQYIAEFNFLFQNSRGTWINGGYGDLLYFIAYLAMALGIFQLRTIINRLK